MQITNSTHSQKGGKTIYFEISLNKNESQQKLFPVDDCGDVKIIYADQTYALQKIYLDTYSEFLKRMFKETNNIFLIQIINQDIDQQNLRDALSLIYGFQITKKIAELDQFYHTLQYLEMATAVQELQMAIISRTYDLNLEEMVATLNFLLRSNLKKATNQLIDRLNASLSLKRDLIAKTPFQNLSEPSFCNLCPLIFLNYWNTYDESQQQLIDDFVQEIIHFYCLKQFSADEIHFELKKNQFNTYYDKEAKSLLQREKNQQHSSSNNASSPTKSNKNSDQNQLNSSNHTENSSKSQNSSNKQNSTNSSNSNPSGNSGSSSSNNQGQQQSQENKNNTNSQANSSNSGSNNNNNNRNQNQRGSHEIGGDVPKNFNPGQGSSNNSNNNNNNIGSQNSENQKKKQQQSLMFRRTDNSLPQQKGEETPTQSSSLSSSSPSLRESTLNSQSFDSLEAAFLQQFSLSQEVQPLKEKIREKSQSLKFTSILPIYELQAAQNQLKSKEIFTLIKGHNNLLFVFQDQQNSQVFGYFFHKHIGGESLDSQIIDDAFAYQFDPFNTCEIKKCVEIIEINDDNFQIGGSEVTFKDQTTGSIQMQLSPNYSEQNSDNKFFSNHEQIIRVSNFAIFRISE